MKYSAEQKQRLKALHRIEFTVRVRKSVMPPRQMLALSAAIAVLLVMLSAGGLTQVGFVLFLLISTAAFYGTMKWARSAKTWDERLDSQLSDYRPLDREAFELLKRKARETGALASSHVEEWLEAERSAVCPESHRSRQWRFAE